MSEAQIQREILLGLGALPDVRLFRNSVGLARDPVTGAMVRFGLAVGSSDLVGIVRPRGRWLAIEVKSEHGRPTREQLAFIEMVRRMGGVAGVARSLAEAQLLLEEARR